jgi:NADH-quinone oxidoreductase subunit M
MFNHGINIIGMWVVVELIERQLGTRKISALGGLAQKHLCWQFCWLLWPSRILLAVYQRLVGEFLMFNGLFNLINGILLLQG